MMYPNPTAGFISFPVARYVIATRAIRFKGISLYNSRSRKLETDFYLASYKQNVKRYLSQNTLS